MVVEKEIFVGAVNRIYFTDGMIKYDMIAFDSFDKNKEPVPKEKLRVVMTPESFIKSYNTIQHLIEIGFFKAKKNIDLCPRE